MKQCNQCRKLFADEAFICPYCGTIYTAPMASAQKKKFSDQRWILLSAVLTMLCVVMLVVTILVSRSASLEATVPSNTDPDTIPQTTTTLAFQETLTLHLVDADGVAVSGVLVRFAGVGSQSQIQEKVSDGTGCAVFKYDRNVSGYSLQIVSVPKEYSQSVIGYYAMEENVAEMRLEIPQQQMPYCQVKVVNEEGLPVPDASVIISGNDGSRRVLVTGEDGCVHVPILNAEELKNYKVNIEDLPDPYCCNTSYNLLLSLEITVYRTQHYSVKVVDQFGEPVQGVQIACKQYKMLSDWIQKTDESGICTFASVMPATVDNISLYSLPDGYWGEETVSNPSEEVVFIVTKITGDEPSADTRYITIQVVNDDGTPVSGVAIRGLVYPQSNGGELRISGNTNENGNIVLKLPLGSWVYLYGYTDESGIFNEELYVDNDSIMLYQFVLQFYDMNTQPAF